MDDVRVRYSDYFDVEQIKSEYAQCDSCHRVGGGTADVRIPVTRYYDHERQIKKTYSYWLCKECRGKLMEALRKCEEGEQDA